MILCIQIWSGFDAAGWKTGQERAFEKRGKQYLLIKSPPASGKSRALMLATNDETLERIYLGRRFKNDTERLEKLFEMYTKMTKKEAPKCTPASHTKI